MINNPPLVSVILPCRNEEKFIGKCLDSVVANMYPKDKLEILVVNGMSDDGTRKILEKCTQRYPFIRILDNPKKITPCALNVGIEGARGEIIMRMDAHATYEKDYISKCVHYLGEYNADNVGGTMVTVPRNNTFIGRAIVIALSHRFGVGNSSFRIGSKELKWVDTVFGGCYRKDVFEKIGLFNEDLRKGQDFEFNTRLRNTGGRILLVPEIVCYYYARSTLNKSFCKFYFGEGFWAIYPTKFVGMKFLSLWRLVPFVFVSSLIITGILSIFSPFFPWLFLFIGTSYLLASQCVSVEISIKKRNFQYLFGMPIVFGTIHIFYGIGSAYAVFRLLIQRFTNHRDNEGTL